MSVKPLKTPENAGGDFEMPEADVYVARCFQMLDLGTQTTHSAKFGTKQQRQLMLVFELLTDDDGEPVTKDDGTPFTINQIYTWSMGSNANLRKAVDAWRGKALTDEEAKNLDLTKLLGTYLKIQVVHNQSGDKTYANVGTVMSTKKRPEGVNELDSYSIDDPDQDTFDKLPEWIKTKINGADENTLSREDVQQHQKEVDDTPVDVKDVQF